MTLQAAGIAPMRFTWRQLTGEPVAVAVRVAQCLSASRRSTLADGARAQGP